MKSRFILIVFITAILVQAGYGQSKAILTGNILDESTGSSLVGATIYIEGTNNGTIADLNGKYMLTNIPAGKHNIVFSFISYQKAAMEMVFAEGETKEMDVNLTMETYGLDEVVVTSQLLGQKKAISQQLSSDAIVNVVSEDKIQELPDVNAAEAIARLPGIALNRSGGEGQKIIIRGMAPQYTAITINGVKVPSNSETDRSVDLSLISPELLSSIEVFKTPLPDMEAESSGGTVNLKLKKAPNKEFVQARFLQGFNGLNNDFGDYKGMLQYSNRLFRSKLGFLVQGNIERFNRSGDQISYGWKQGNTDAETGITAIQGYSLRLIDSKEIRKRANGSINLDYDLNTTNSLNFFGLFSRTSRDRFSMTNGYVPTYSSISFSADATDYILDLSTFSLGGDHVLGLVKIDWNVSSSTSKVSSTDGLSVAFNVVTTGGVFDSDLERTGNPSYYLDAALMDEDEVYLSTLSLGNRDNFENTKSAFVNFQIPIQFSNSIKGNFKFGGRYNSTNRDRNVTSLSEVQYYLGTAIVDAAADLYDGELTYIPSNPSLISSNNFSGTNDFGVVLENGEDYDFPVSLDKDKLQSWASIQKNTLKEDRAVTRNNYEVTENLAAVYAMFKLNIGDKLMIIPGFRYEYSDNEYLGRRSDVNGLYGVNGSIIDTTTTQSYGKFFPHLHLKYKPFDWFDVRASYARTIARPSFSQVIPNAQINNSFATISAGNPNLKSSVTDAYDVSCSFFDQKLGLFTIGGFYKDVDNMVVKRTMILTDEDLAAENGWSGYSGYELTSYANLSSSKVWGYETEMQTNLSWLPKPFSGIVLSLNYARLFSETKEFFLTSETTYSGGFPPVPSTTYIQNERTVVMPTQAPHIFSGSLGYDINGFSVRVSGSYQGTKAVWYSSNKDFDYYNLHFWRWDASAKQTLGEKWSIFLNVNNIFNQKDISFIRDENYISSINTYGCTGTIGVQYRFSKTN